MEVVPLFVHIVCNLAPMGLGNSRDFDCSECKALVDIWPALWGHFCGLRLDKNLKRLRGRAVSAPYFRSRVRNPLEARFFPNLNGTSLHRAFHVHPSIVLIWLKYGWKGRKNPNSSILILKNPAQNMAGKCEITPAGLGIESKAPQFHGAAGTLLSSKHDT